MTRAPELGRALATRAPALVVAAALLTLIPVAVLQHRWITEVAEAERERRSAHLRASVMRFADEFNTDIARLSGILLHGPVPHVMDDRDVLALRLDALDQLRAPRALVRRFLHFRSGSSQVSIIDLSTGEIRSADWPPDLADAGKRLQQPKTGPMPRPLTLRSCEGNPLLVTPLVRLHLRSDRPLPPLAPPDPALTSWLILELDLDYLQKHYLPALVERHFAGLGDELAVRVVDGENGDDLYRTASVGPDFFRRPEAVARLLLPRLGPDAFPGVPGVRRHAPWEARAQVFERQVLVEKAGIGQGTAAFVLHEPGGPWRLEVQHLAGSLEEIVERTRRRNLVISLTVSLLLAAAIAILFLAARRAQRLAQLQMEFVAGVSHELRTPLSVICSAGDNLAGGIVGGEESVRRYGGVIRDEGKRLSRMVEQILRFAGIQSAEPRLTFSEVPPADLIQRALATCQSDIDRAGMDLEIAIEPNLPAIRGDETALVHCLRNLIDNAIKHAAEGYFIRIAAGPGPMQNSVQIRVEDHGPGISRHEMRRIFDPFYRGRRAQDAQTRGSGLGLALVRRLAEAQGGSVRVEENDGGGSAFTLTLPAASKMVTPPLVADGETGQARTETSPGVSP